MRRRKTFTGCLAPSAQWQTPWMCSSSHWPLSNIGPLKNHLRDLLKILKAELVFGKAQEGKFQKFPKKFVLTLHYKLHGCRRSFIVTNWGLRNRTRRSQQFQDPGRRKGKLGRGGLRWDSLNRALALASRILASITSRKAAMRETPAILALGRKVRKTTTPRSSSRLRLARATWDPALKRKEKKTSFPVWRIQKLNSKDELISNFLYYLLPPNTEKWLGSG